MASCKKDTIECGYFRIPEYEQAFSISEWKSRNFSWLSRFDWLKSFEITFLSIQTSYRWQMLKNRKAIAA